MLAVSHLSMWHPNIYCRTELYWLLQLFRAKQFTSSTIPEPWTSNTSLLSLSVSSARKSCHGLCCRGICARLAYSYMRRCPYFLAPCPCHLFLRRTVIPTYNPDWLAQKYAQCSWHSSGAENRTSQPVICKIISNWINVPWQSSSFEGLCFVIAGLCRDSTGYCKCFTIAHKKELLCRLQTEQLWDFFMQIFPKPLTHKNRNVRL